MNDLITLAIPTYNGEKYLAATLESAILQQYQPLEILIVDDGSDDSSLKIVQHYAKVDDRIKIVQNGQNLGLVGNWNRCLELAKGEWIKFLFQDDLLVEDAIQEMYEAARQYKQNFVVCNRNFRVEENATKHFKTFYEDKVVKLDHFFEENTIVKSNRLQELIKENGLFQNIIGEPTTYFLHRSILEKYGNFRTGLIHLCDYEFALRVGLNEGLLFLPKPLATFRVHGSSESDKNRQERAVGMDYTDKLLILHDFIHLPIYENFRNLYGAENMLQEYQQMYNSMVRRLGWKNTRIILRSYINNFEHLGELKFSWSQAWKKVSKKVGLSKDA